MESDVINMSDYYKYGEKTIKSKNYKLWEYIINWYNNLDQKNDIKFKEKFYLYENNLTNTPKCECNTKVDFIDMRNGYDRNYFRIFDCGSKLWEFTINI